MVVVSSSFGFNRIYVISIGVAQPVAALHALLFVDANGVASVGNSMTILNLSIIVALLFNVFLSLSNNTDFTHVGLNLWVANCSFKYLTCIFDRSFNDIDNGILTSAASASLAVIGSVCIGASSSYSLSDGVSLQ